MPFTGIANPSDIRVMTEALGIYCQERGITNLEERDHVAEMIVSLFFSGRNTTEALLDGLKNGHLYQPPKNGDHGSHA